MESLRRIAALLGRLIGLRTQESEVTVTVEGKWKGWFDPVRLSLFGIIVALVVLMGFCAGCSTLLDDLRDEQGTRDLVTEGPYECCP